MTTTLHPSVVGTSGANRGGRSRIGARLAAVGLVVGAGGNTAQAVLSQVLGERPAGVDDQVALAQQNPTLLTAMGVVGLVAVPFMAIGFLAAAQELGRRAHLFTKLDVDNRAAAIVLAREAGLGG